MSLTEHPSPVTTGDWNSQTAADAFNVQGWSGGFFGISDSGEILVYLQEEVTDPPKAFSLPHIVEQLRARGLEDPLLLRFPSILESRIRGLHEGFRNAFEKTNYKGEYRGVFPIKVNQQQRVIEEVTIFGSQFHFGLEAGSKPELMAAIAYLKDPNALIVCNGYKDRQFVDLALLARKMGLNVIIVIETAHELQIVFDRAKALNVEASVGIRVKLTSEGEGYWAKSGGEHSPFGLTYAQLFETLERLRSEDKLHWLNMLHCHQGSQIPNLETIESATREAARIFVELQKEGASMRYLNLGGGLAVDYMGTCNSGSHHSAAYSLNDYSLKVTQVVQEVAREAGVEEPTIVTESGRATTAHYSVLIIKLIDVDRFEEVFSDHGPNGTADSANPEIELLRQIAAGKSGLKPEEATLEAAKARSRHRERFIQGEISLKDQAGIEKLYWQAVTSVYRNLDPAETSPDFLEPLERQLADQCYGNFSIFQSLADSWAIDQIFPVLPIQRLNEPLTRYGVVHDLTCDCDGMIKHYPYDGAIRGNLPLHSISKNEDYYLGAFLVGAYQETLSDLHNLFGDANAISVEVVDGKLEFTSEVEGDTVADVLSYVEHDPKQLIRDFRRLAEAAVNEGRVSPAERKRALDAYKAGMASYTYISS